MSELGLVQGILAPQERPDIYTLKKLGFRGSDSQILEKAYKQVPNFFNACCSASSMWAANAATVSPSPDCADNKVHFTTANLIDKFHRSIEHNTTITNSAKHIYQSRIFLPPSSTSFSQLFWG